VRMAGFYPSDSIRLSLIFSFTYSLLNKCKKNRQSDSAPLSLLFAKVIGSMLGDFTLGEGVFEGDFCLIKVYFKIFRRLAITGWNEALLEPYFAH
jgi:hypothetical protein